MASTPIPAEENSAVLDDLIKEEADRSAPQQSQPAAEPEQQSKQQEVDHSVIDDLMGDKQS